MSLGAVSEAVGITGRRYSSVGQSEGFISPRSLVRVQLPPLCTVRQSPAFNEAPCSIEAGFAVFDDGAGLGSLLDYTCP